jgi:hypothetical protein
LSPGSLGLVNDSSETKSDQDYQSQKASEEKDKKDEYELVLSPGPLGVIDDSSETKSDQDEEDQDCQVGYRVSK